MLTEVLVPSPGESINQVIISKWLVEDNQFININTDIAEIDSDKATLVISSDVSGIIHILIPEGETADVGRVIAQIEQSEAHTQTTTHNNASIEDSEESSILSSNEPAISLERTENSDIKLTPLANSILEKEGIDKITILDFIHSKKINAQQVLRINEEIQAQAHDSITELSRKVERKKLSPLRLKLSERLVSVKNETAMLTTFNEIDMSYLLDIKTRFNQEYKDQIGFNIGLMSFFTKAASIALKKFPQVNSQIENNELISFNYCDISIAVSSPKGLVVPIVRNTELKNITEIEKEIKQLAIKAKENKLSISEMNGGTFTISNGGVFGSMMSTPIINPPQSAILGMHNIIDRPIAFNGHVIIRPMMYVALSYDHRIIDGQESVSFLKTIKELIENPLSLMFEGKNPFKKLLSID
ncbi:MAG: dihydrolipoyllysine-residue succinyltransferase [Bacteroidales bacterium]|nr:dihydrolipoyllysine-residue succinyltransferase [Bacteroidales bacterium]